MHLIYYYVYCCNFILALQYLKAKRDKEKALKLLIQLIGKEKLQKHIQTHAGSPDLLDSIVQAFGTANTHHRPIVPEDAPPKTPINEK